jgi:hypothetical protein
MNSAMMFIRRSMSMLGVLAFAFLASEALASEQSLPTNTKLLVEHLPAPLPAQVEVYATDSSRPDHPLTVLSSPDQAKCVSAQLAELQKVADAAGGNQVLIDDMEKSRISFGVWTIDKRSGKPTKHNPGIFRNFEPKLTYQIVSILSNDSKGHPHCSLTTSEQLIKWLKDDSSHLVRFPNHPANVHPGPRSNGARAI